MDESLSGLIAWTHLVSFIYISLQASLSLTTFAFAVTVEFLQDEICIMYTHPYFNCWKHHKLYLVCVCIYSYSKGKVYVCTCVHAHTHTQFIAASHLCMLTGEEIPSKGIPTHICFS